MTSKLKKFRKDILTVSFLNKSGHVPSAFSILEILYYLYSEVLREEDSFFLSKGHGCLALYAVFLDLGFITQEDFDSFSLYDSILGGHPDRNKIKGVLCSSGSLGHGLPMAIGAALSKKIQKKCGNVYCLIGDGESNEGTTWESAILANHLKLENLICLVDNNNSQIRSVSTRTIKEKFISFGWHVLEVNNGHDKSQVLNSFDNISQDKPTCIIFNTKKGHGIKEIEENMFAWHHRAPTEKEMEKFFKEMGE